MSSDNSEIAGKLSATRWVDSSVIENLRTEDLKEIIRKEKGIGCNRTDDLIIQVTKAVESYTDIERKTIKGKEAHRDALVVIEKSMKKASERLLQLDNEVVDLLHFNVIRALSSNDLKNEVCSSLVGVETISAIAVIEEASRETAAMLEKNDPVKFKWLLVEELSQLWLNAGGKITLSESDLFIDFCHICLEPVSSDGAYPPDILGILRGLRKKYSKSL